MIEKSTIQKVLIHFMNNPSKEFHLRELSRLLKLSMPTIISATSALSREGWIIRTKSKVVTKVRANIENVNFIRQKRIHNLEKTYNSGIVDYLSRAYKYPKGIILFGSFSRGDDVENSDVDIAVLTEKRKELNLEPYEKLLEKSISIHEISLDKIGKEFKSNLTNGIMLEGSW